MAVDVPPSAKDRGGVARMRVIPPADGQDGQFIYSSPAVVAGGWVFASARTPVPVRSYDSNPFELSELEIQADDSLAALDRTFRTAGADLRRDAVRIQWWLASQRPSLDDFARGNLWAGIDDLGPLHEVRQRYLDPPLPASTGIGVRQLVSPQARLAVGAIGIEGNGGRFIEVTTDELPHLPDSAAVRAGDWVFTVGLIASDWNGDFMSRMHMGSPGFVAPSARTNPYVWFGSPVESQVDYVLREMEVLARAAGSSLERAVRAEVFIGHPADLYGLNRAWRRWFPDSSPARVVVPYSALAGQGIRVEVSLTLLADSSALVKETIETSEAPEPTGPAPQAVAVGDFVFLSGQAPVDSRGVVPPQLLETVDFPYAKDLSAAQADYTIANIEAICRAAGASLETICWRNTFLDDLSAIPAVMEQWTRHSSGALPAGAELGLGSGWPVLASGSRLLFDAIAYRSPMPG